MPRFGFEGGSGLRLKIQSPRIALRLCEFKLNLRTTNRVVVFRLIAGHILWPFLITSKESARLLMFLRSMYLVAEDMDLKRQTDDY